MLKKRLLNKIFEKPKFYKWYRYYKNFNIRLFFKTKYPVKDIVVCGMPRSGSTLLFNIIRLMLSKYSNKIDPYFTNDSEYDKLLSNNLNPRIRKNHRYSPLLARRIEAGYTIGFFTHRDIRDVVVSLMEKGRITNFNSWIDRRKLKKIVNDALLYARLKKVIIIKYSDLMNEKEKVILLLMKTLSIELTQEEITELLIKTDIESTKLKLKELAPFKEYEFENHLHRNHIKDGKIGKWKEVLNQEQIKVIEDQAIDFIKYFGY